MIGTMYMTCVQREGGWCEPFAVCTETTRKPPVMSSAVFRVKE